MRANQGISMKKFLRYGSRHCLWFPGDWRLPQINPLVSSSHSAKSGKRTFRCYEPVWLMRLRQRLFCFAGRHRCGGRWFGQSPKFGGDKALPDTWDLMADGTRTCSYCGSLHEEDLFDILQHYVAGDPGYSFSTTDKGYKLYAHRPGAVNASLGGIKFYKCHVDHNHPDFEKREALFRKACEKQNAEWRAYLGKTQSKSSCSNAS